MVQLAPAFVSTSTNENATCADRLARRRELIAERFAALRGQSRNRLYDLNEYGPAFSRAPVLGEPVLSRSERARLHIEVEISRDLQLWSIGRASPCYWLLVVTETVTVNVSVEAEPAGEVVEV